MTLTNEKPIVLGRVSGLFGVKGWVKIFSYTEPREAILDYRECLLGSADSWSEAQFAEGQSHGKSVIARFSGVDDRDRAEQLIGHDIAVSREVLPPPAKGEYYWADLEGLAVVSPNGTRLGVVSKILATGANDVLVVEGDREILIPFLLEDVIQNVDLDKGEITADWEADW